MFRFAKIVTSNKRSFSTSRATLKPKASGFGKTAAFIAGATTTVVAAGLTANYFLQSEKMEEEEKKFEINSSLFDLVPAVSAAEPNQVAHFGAPGTNKERTFIAIKPDGVNRGLISDIIGRFEKKGFKLVGLKFLKPTKQFAEEHYDDLKSKPFFPSLTTYFSSGPVVAMVWEGKDVIKTGRKLIGATNPAAAEPGTIRGDYCIIMGRNIIHGSDSAEAAEHEISLWFKENEVADWESALNKWTYEN